MKRLKYCQNYQNVTQRQSKANAVGKTMSIDLFDAGLPMNLQFVKNSALAQHSEVKHTRMWDACK